MKDKLLKTIEEQGGVWPNKYEVLVSVDEFFQGNDVLSSFAANACWKSVNVYEFYKIFLEIKQNKNVQDVWISIDSIEEDWPNSDTAFISTTLTKEEIYNYFGDAFPNEISDDDPKKEKYKYLPNIKDGYKLYCLWWD